MMPRSGKSLLLLLAMSGLCDAAGPVLEPGEDRPGGDTTIDETGKNAFAIAAPNVSESEQTDFVVGNSFFKKNWVEAPSSTATRDGLGPHFIARSCSGCHANDGRGAPPESIPAGAPTAAKGPSNEEQPVALLIRLSVPGTDGHGGPRPEPSYGGQFNNRAVGGVKPEGTVTITRTAIEGRFADGERYSLESPRYGLDGLNYGPLAAGTMLSPRVAPQMIGLGLLEAIRVEDIEANALRQAASRSAIRGRPNHVWDAPSGRMVIGRFGWKANTGSIAHQSAGAFAGDIGITSSHFPVEDCTAKQADCLAAARGGNPEIDDRLLAKVVLYSRTLAVPARRGAADPMALRGRALFVRADCAVCHVRSYVTGASDLLPGSSALSKQRIFPYTDLLLHDMGEGLADGRPDFEASGRQWKTPPLWGVGLIPAVNGHSRYLHDGRARNLTEAVLWHDGEARGAREQFLKMTAAERRDLMLFLSSL